MKIDNIPLRAPKNKKQYLSFNMNHFRSNHFHVNNKMKVYMHNIIKGKCFQKTAPEPPLQLIYTLYRKDKRKIDLANVLSIIDKFVSDGLVEAGMISDDNVNIIQQVIFRDGGIDRLNPRCDLEILRMI